MSPSPTGPPAKPGKARISMLATFKAPDRDNFYFENRKQKKKCLHTSQSFPVHHKAPDLVLCSFAGHLQVCFKLSCLTVTNLFFHCSVRALLSESDLFTSEAIAFLQLSPHYANREQAAWQSPWSSVVRSTLPFRT